MAMAFPIFFRVTPMRAALPITLVSQYRQRLGDEYHLGPHLSPFMRMSGWDNGVRDSLT